MFSCKNNLQFLAPLMGFTLMGHSNLHQSFSTNYLQFRTHCVQLAFFLPANKHPTSYEDISAIRYQRLQNLAWMFFQQLFILTSKPPFTTQWQQCGQAWKLKHSFPIRTELVAENAIFGTRQAVWKKDSEVSQFLKKILGLSLLKPAEVCDCFALEFLSNLPNKRVEQFCDYLLENYIEIDSTFLLLFGPNVLHHH
jgi:hypothetical protein